MTNKMDATLRIVIKDFERRYDGQHPYCTLTNIGTENERWFVFYPADLTKPFASVDKDGTGYEHV